MQYIITCPLGYETTADARALYARLAALLLERFYEVNCKFELRSEELAFKPASMPSYMKNYKSEYFGVFTLQFKGYSAYIDGALRDLAEDFGLDYVEWTQDGSKFRISSADRIVAAYERAYGEAA